MPVTSKAETHARAEAAAAQGLRGVGFDVRNLNELLGHLAGYFPVSDLPGSRLSLRSDRKNADGR